MYDQKFFNGLKEKLKRDLKTFFEIKGFTRERLNVLDAIYRSLGTYEMFIDSRINPQPPLERVMVFGEKNNWPPMILKRDGDKIIKSLNGGLEYWENAFAWQKLNEPYRRNFKDLVDAVDRNDIWQKEK